MLFILLMSCGSGPESPRRVLTVDKVLCAESITKAIIIRLPRKPPRKLLCYKHQRILLTIHGAGVEKLALPWWVPPSPSRPPQPYVCCLLLPPLSSYRNSEKENMIARGSNNPLEPTSLMLCPTKAFKDL